MSQKTFDEFIHYLKRHSKPYRTNLLHLNSSFFDNKEMLKKIMGARWGGFSTNLIVELPINNLMLLNEILSKIAV